jgi:hypothetical protein
MLFRASRTNDIPVHSLTKSVLNKKRFALMTPHLIFVTKVELHLSANVQRNFKVRLLLSLPTNIRLGWKRLRLTNTLTYFGTKSITTVNRFIGRVTGDKIMDIDKVINAEVIGTSLSFQKKRQRRQDLSKTKTTPRRLVQRHST